MTIARIIAAALLVIGGLYCLAWDARSARVRAERDVRRERLSVDDPAFNCDPGGPALYLGGWFAGMICLIFAAVVLS